MSQRTLIDQSKVNYFYLSKSHRSGDVVYVVEKVTIVLEGFCVLFFVL